MKVDNLLSIITISYNSKKTIQNTFKSIKDQEDQNFEYIVVDGDSNDGTKKLIKSFDRVDKFICEKDRGLYDALNKGILMSTSRYVGILHSDDVFYSPSSISEIKKLLMNSNDDAHLFGAVQVNSKEKIIRKIKVDNWKSEKLYRGFMPPHISTIYSRNIFDKFGLYDIKYSVCGDYEHAVRLFLKNKIKFKKHNLYLTRMRIGGKSTSGFNSYKIISKEICKSFEDNDLYYSPFRIWTRAFFKIFQLI